MENITIELANQYKAKIKYSVNGSVNVEEVEITPRLEAGDVSYGQDVSVPMGETIGSEATILKYFEDCKIKDEKLFDSFTAAILKRQLEG